MELFSCIQVVAHVVVVHVVIVQVSSVTTASPVVSSVIGAISFSIACSFVDSMLMASFFCEKNSDAVKITRERTNIAKMTASFFLLSSAVNLLFINCGLTSGISRISCIFFGLHGPLCFILGFLEINAVLGLPRDFLGVAVVFSAIS